LLQSLLNVAAEQAWAINWARELIREGRA